MLSEGKGGLGVVSAGAQKEVALGKYGALLTADASGRYTEAVRAGRVYTAYSTPAAIPVAYGTEAGQQMCLWNPPDSGVDVVLLGVSYAQTVTTASAAQIGVAGYTGQTFTETTAVDHYGCLRVGGGRGKARAVEVGTFVGAEYFFLPLIELQTGALTVDSTLPAFIDLGGLIVAPPGTGLGTQAAGTAPAAGTFIFGSIVWEEVPRE